MRVTTLVALVLAASIGQPPVAQAQDLSGPVYVVREGSAQPVKGRLLELGPETLTLLVDNQRVQMPLDSVSRVDVPGDSIKNGAVTGALFFGGWSALVWQGLGRKSEYFRFVLLQAGVGAVFGAGIDALNTGKTLIYRKVTASNHSSSESR